MSWDPALRGILTATAEAGRQPARSTDPLVARQAMEARAQPGTRELADISDETLQAHGRTFRVRVYTPSPDATGVIVYLHGGGWVMGSVDTADAVARELAGRAGAYLVSVDYSLAPEHPFPAPIEDAVAAVEYAATRFPGQAVALAGESSGANLAIAAARTLGPSLELAALALWYPPADARGRHADDPGGDGVLPLVDADDMTWFWSHYVGDDSLLADPDVSPVLAGDLHLLPPTTMVLAGHDPVRAEAEELVGRLQAAGVQVQVHREETLAHGFLAFQAAVPAAAATITTVAAALAERLRQGNQ